MKKLHGPVGPYARRESHEPGDDVKKILIIDDDQAFLHFLRNYVGERYPGLEVKTCSDPMQGLAAITADLDLLLVDLEMPGLDGTKILSYAISKGLNKGRVIILSGRDAEYLHQRIPMGSCLAVLNKFEAAQQTVLDMIFSSLHRKYKAIEETEEKTGP
jgi:CheY-like chemotaxis protein